MWQESEKREVGKRCRDRHLGGNGEMKRLKDGQRKGIHGQGGVDKK